MTDFYKIPKLNNVSLDATKNMYDLHNKYRTDAVYQKLCFYHINVIITSWFTLEFDDVALRKINKKRRKRDEEITQSKINDWFKVEEERIGLKHKLHQAMMHTRLSGGGGLLLDIEDEEYTDTQNPFQATKTNLHNLEYPIDFSNKYYFKGVIPFSAMELQFVTPSQYYPHIHYKYYPFIWDNQSLNQNTNLSVHDHRLCVIKSTTYERIEQENLIYFNYRNENNESYGWGASELWDIIPAYERLRAHRQDIDNFSDISSKIILEDPYLEDQLRNETPHDISQRNQATFTKKDSVISVAKGTKIEHLNVNSSSIDAVWLSQKALVAEIAGVPIQFVFNVQPNTSYLTNDHTTRAFFKSIDNYRESYLKNILYKICYAMLGSASSPVRDHILSGDLKFKITFGRSQDTSIEQEVTDLLKMSQLILLLSSQGLVHTQEARDSIRQMKGKILILDSVYDKQIEEQANMKTQLSLLTEVSDVEQKSIKGIGMPHRHAPKGLNEISELHEIIREKAGIEQGLHLGIKQSPYNSNNMMEGFEGAGNGEFK